MSRTAAIRAGRAQVELSVDKSALVAGLRRAQASIQRFGANVASVARGFAIAGGAIAAPLAASVAQFATFEQQMANVSTMLGDDSMLAGLSDGIRQMSVEFGEGTDTLSKGLYDILSASIPADKALGVLRASAMAAKAGLTDTGVAADAITTIINSYGMSADSAADVSDWLFSVVKRGKTTFAELAPNIGTVATLAASGGVSLDEMGAALATMTRNGVGTESAVTALQAIITSFLSPSAEATAYAKELGFEMSGATLQAEGLGGVFNRIKDLPPDAIARLFPNVRAIRGVLPALKNMEGFADDVSGIGNRAGATQVAYEKMANTLTTAFARIKQAVLDVAVEVGSVLGPVVKVLSNIITGALVVIRKWISEHKGIVAIAAAVAAALLLIAGALAAVATVASIASFIIGGLISALTALAAVFAAITSPIGLAIIAAVALYGTLGYLLSRTQVGQRVLGALGETFRRVAGYIAEFGRAMWAAISAGNWQAALELAQSALLVVWTATKNKMADIWAQFTAILQDGFFLALYTIREAWDMFADAFEGRLLRIAKMITGLGGSFLLGQLEGVREDLESLEGLQGEANDARRRDDAERRRAARQAEQDAMDRYRAALAAANAAGEASKSAEGKAAEGKAKDAAVSGAAVAGETSSRILSLGTFSGSLAKQLARGSAFDQVTKETRRAADAAEGIEDRLDQINELAFA